MLNQTEANMLQKYIINLERENQAKTQEQFILYRQIQALQKQYANMERYYVENRLMKAEIQKLNQSLRCALQREMLYQNRLQQIQQISEENIRLEDFKKESDIKICLLEQELQSKNIRLREIQTENSALKKNISKKQSQYGRLTESFQQQYDENVLLRQKIDDFSREINMQNMQNLVQNYEKIEQIVLQKEQNIRELEAYILNLQQQCQNSIYLYRKAQSHIKELEAQLVSLHTAQSIEEDSLEQMTQGIPKIQLIRQNNKMLERIMQLEKQNRNHNDQRYAYSECGDPKRDSPSKLQMRIQTLKMQNENLMRNLAI